MQESLTEGTRATKSRNASAAATVEYPSHPCFDPFSPGIAPRVAPYLRRMHNETLINEFRKITFTINQRNL